MVARSHDFYAEARANPVADALGSDNVNLIGFACGMGAPNPGCAYGPEVLKQMNLPHALHDYGVSEKWKSFLKSSIQELDKNLCIEYLTLQYKTLAQEVAKSIRQRERFIVIGGDHSCAIGTWSGAAHQIRKLGSLGLIWVDAHMDSHTPVSSHSGALHGMPLACLLGYGDYQLTNILSVKPKIAPQHVCLVGVRSFETEEAQLLKHLGVRIIFMQEVKERGLVDVFEEALTIANTGTAGFGLSIDLDSIDPLDAPGVGTPELGGLSREELLDALKIFPQQRKLLGIEIAELNPSLDQNQITAKLALETLIASLAKV